MVDQQAPSSGASFLRTQARWRASFLKSLVVRDLKNRYQGAVFSWLWPIIVQLSQLFVFTFLFASIFHVRAPIAGSSGGPLSYGFWLFSALISWNMLSNGVVGASSAIVGQPNLVKRVAFPLALLPLVPVCSAAIEALAGYLVLFILMAVAGYQLHDTFIFIPILLLLQMVLVGGLAYFVAALTPYVRDVPQTLGPLLLFAFYLTPIVYPLDLVPRHMRRIADLNPMTGFVEAFRNAALNGHVFEHAALVIYSIAWSLVVFCAGYLFFRRLRPGFGDVL